MSVGSYIAAAGTIVLVIIVFIIMLVSLIVTGIIYVTAGRDKNKYWSVLTKLGFLTFVVFILLLLCITTYASPTASLVIAILTIFVFIAGLFWLFHTETVTKTGTCPTKCDLETDDFTL